MRNDDVTRRNAGIRLAAAIAAAFVTVVTGAGPAFYPDDPIWRFPETQDASNVKDRPPSQGFDFIENTLMHPGERVDRPAGNINTIDEVPDSSWFTNRIISEAGMGLDAIARGPDTSDGPAPGTWTVAAGEAEGVTPGFRMRDTRGALFFIKTDPPRNAELASAAEVISTKIFHALGYNVPENSITRFRREQLDISTATVTLPNGTKRALTDQDLDEIFAKISRSPDGSYRVMASRALPGKPIGPFQYYGTRADDPNDLVPHEHRRELRAMRVFAAWVNHMDSRGINSLDTLVDTDAGKRVRHHLLDFGSTLGSAAIAVKSRRSGNEYLWDIPKSFLRIFTLGLAVPSWTTIDFPDKELPSVGGFESKRFDAEKWVPHYPNPAMSNSRADDVFWGARRVMAFSDAAIAAVVRAGRFSDTRAEEYLTRTLIERRDKIGRAWLTGINPLVDFRLDAGGTLTFRNAALDAGVASAPVEYRMQWSALDNATGTATPQDQPAGAADPTTRAPGALLADREFIRVGIESVHRDHPVWRLPVRATFRRTDGGWKLVGVERQVEKK